jgi:hypothetical protein
MSYGCNYSRRETKTTLQNPPPIRKSTVIFAAQVHLRAEDRAICTGIKNVVVFNTGHRLSEERELFGGGGEEAEEASSGVAQEQGPESGAVGTLAVEESAVREPVATGPGADCGCVAVAAHGGLPVVVSSAGVRFHPLPAGARDRAQGGLRVNTPPALGAGRAQVRSTFPDHAPRWGVDVESERGTGR